MTIALDLWAAGLGMLIAGYWYLIVAALVAGVVLFVKRKRLLGLACWVVSLVVAPYVQFFVWNSQTNATKAWLGDWRGNFGQSRVQLEFQSNSATTLSGRMLASTCHPGGEIVAVVNGRNITILTADLEVMASLAGDSNASTGTVTGCAEDGGEQDAELVKN